MAAMVIKLAEAPEFTNTLYFIPSHADHSASKARTFLLCVRIGLSCFKKAISVSRSSRVILLYINGQLRAISEFPPQRHPRKVLEAAESWRFWLSRCCPRCVREF